MKTYTAEEFLKEYKGKWINYCEIIILRDGKIVLAQPSHLECLLRLTNEPREVIYEKMPIYESPIEWFINYLKVVSVWDSFQMISDEFTVEQSKTLELLEKEEMIISNRKVIIR